MLLLASDAGGRGRLNSYGLLVDILVMTHSRSPWSEEEESWWDVLGAVFEPLGEVALYVAIFIIGGGLIGASSRTPIIPLAIGVVAVIVSVYVASRMQLAPGADGHRPLSGHYRAGHRRSSCWRWSSLPILGHDSGPCRATARALQ
jgi:hypothetical protein